MQVYEIDCKNQSKLALYGLWKTLFAFVYIYIYNIALDNYLFTNKLYEGTIMTTFSESNVNNYLNSISANLIELQSFANDIESNFVNCFQTRFTMTQVDIDNMNSWPTFLKDQIALATRFTVDYYATDTNIDLDFEIEGFEAPAVANEANAKASAAAGDLKLNFRGSLDYNQSTGTIKYKAKVKLKYYIC